MIERKKNELLVYTKENKLDEELDVGARKEMKEVEVETNEKNFFGKNKTKIVKEWTGNLIISKKDYFKLNKNIKNGLKAGKKLYDILESDVYKENLD